MDSKPQNDLEDDNRLVFQNLIPEEPANAFQKSIIRMQQNGSKRYLLIFLAVLSGFLTFLLIFRFAHPSTQQINTTKPVTQSNSTIEQPLAYANVIYVVVTPTTSTTGTLEALNAQTGKLVWSYPQHTVQGYKIFGHTLYVQTDTNLIALNADTRTQLWTHQMFSDAASWQTDQGILFTQATNKIVTALSASTGVELWETNQPSGFWRDDNGIFYTATASSPGLSALNALNGKQLWHNATIDPVSTPGDVNVDPGTALNDAYMSRALAINNGTVYLQNSKNHNIQAFDGKNGTMLWQIDTHGKGFTLSPQNGFLVLSDSNDAQVETLDDQTGKLLWQHQGTLDYFTTDKTPNQTIISSLQNNETDAVRTNDGTILYHIPHADNTPKSSPHIETLFAIANGLALFTVYTQQYDVAYSDPKVVAVRISDGVSMWSSQTLKGTPWLQDNTVEIVSISGNALLALHANNGHTLWQHTFSAAGR